jgi:hypothetical protein
MRRAEAVLPHAQQVLHGNFWHLGHRQLSLAPVCAAHDVADGEASPGPGDHWGARGMVLAVHVMRLHGSEGRCVLEGEVADGGEIVAASVRP